jgi:MarR family transcriptional regulator, 2-MHQ and catechol-resistance regulon repressor
MPKKSYGEGLDTALDVWIKLARAYTTFSRLATKDILSHGLTLPQFGVLESLGHLGAMSTGELCRKLLVSGGNMTVVLDNLQKEGLIERVQSTEDRRTINVSLTEKGKHLFETVFPKHAHEIGELASVLTVDEQRELSRLLKKLGLALAQQL